MSLRMSKSRNLNDFLALLKGGKRAHDGQYVALRPGHYDTKPSLSIRGSEVKQNPQIHITKLAWSFCHGANVRTAGRV